MTHDAATGGAKGHVTSICREALSGLMGDFDGRDVLAQVQLLDSVAFNADQLTNTLKAYRLSYFSGQDRYLD